MADGVLTKQIRLAVVAGGVLYFGILARLAWAIYRLNHVQRRSQVAGLQETVTLWTALAIGAPVVGLALGVAIRWALRDDAVTAMPWYRRSVELPRLTRTEAVAAVGGGIAVIVVGALWLLEPR